MGAENLWQLPSSNVIRISFLIFMHCYILVVLYQSLSVRNLKSFFRSTQGQERLSSLALMHIHYSLHIDLDEVVESSKVKNPLLHPWPVVDQGVNLDSSVDYNHRYFQSIIITGDANVLLCQYKYI